MHLSQYENDEASRLTFTHLSSDAYAIQSRLTSSNHRGSSVHDSSFDHMGAWSADLYRESPSFLSFDEGRMDDPHVVLTTATGSSFHGYGPQPRWFSPSGYCESRAEEGFARTRSSPGHASHGDGTDQGTWRRERQPNHTPATSFTPHSQRAGLDSASSTSRSSFTSIIDPKSLIERIYVQEKRTLKEVIEVLHRDFDNVPSYVQLFSCSKDRYTNVM